MNLNCLKHFIALAALCSSTGVGAQSKLDLESRWTLMQGQNSRGGVMTPSRRARKALDSTGSPTAEVKMKTHMMGMIKLESETAKADLLAAGVKILRQRGDLVLVTMPIDSVDNIARLEGVRKVQLARRVYPMMDRSREVAGVNKIHQGLGLPQAYTGKGVVTGIVDNGFDPNHVNFLKPDGTTRFGYMSNIYASSLSSSGYIYENYYPRAELTEQEEPYTYAIEDFKTDDKTDYHGTHTLGTMAGSYKGVIRNAVIDPENKDKAVIEEVANPYYGCATESELVASTGDFDYYDMFIMYGIDDCINYALYSNGATADGWPVKEKPCVINLSLGRPLGPHDKNGLLNQYLAAAGNEAIICISAGNEADYPICLHKEFKGEDNTLQSFFKPIEEGEYNDGGNIYHNIRYGETYIYSGDSTEFEVQIVVYNQKRGSIAKRFSVSTSTEGSYVVYASSTDYASSATVDATFAKAFDGYVAIGSMKDEDTGKYYAIVNILASDNQESNADGNYILGLVVNGKDGKRVDVWGDAQFTYFDSYKKSGWVDGTRDGTVSDLAIGDNVIVVGAYNNRVDLGFMDGYTTSLAEELPEGEVSVFSSYSTLLDGTTLPHVCGPGTAVVSSANSYYIENKSYKFDDSYLNAKNTDNGRNNYWIASTGTSMSTPLVAGSIALWLEADPTLKYADVLDIIQKTAVKDEQVKNGNPVQWGAGKFDAYAGLKEVLRRKDEKATAIGEVKATKSLVSALGGKSFSVFMAGAEGLNVSVYNSLGQKVLDQSTAGEEMTVNAGSLPTGVYFVKVNNGETQRIIIRN